MTCLTRVDGSVEIGSGGFNFDGHSSSLGNGTTRKSLRAKREKLYNRD